jgi:hypothetical protein
MQNKYYIKNFFEFQLERSHSSVNPGLDIQPLNWLDGRSRLSADMWK